MTCAAVAFGGGVASADSWEGEGGKGRWSEARDDSRRYYAREYKEEFRTGRCKVKREWKRDGGYKEEIKCKGRWDDDDDDDD